MQIKFVFIGFIVTLLLVSSKVFAQSDSTKTLLPEVVIYANKFPKPSKNIVQKVDFISDKNTINQQANTAVAFSAVARRVLLLRRVGRGPAPAGAIR